MIINKNWGMTSNDWNALYHENGREKGGTEFLANQLLTLKLALENAKELDEYYSKPQDYGYWNYNGKQLDDSEELFK